MPIYGYHCGACGHEFEVMQSMSDAPLRTCPECGGALRKLLYPVGVQFKGSGFYTTDYRNGSNGSRSTGKGEGSDGGSKSSEGSKASKSSEGGGSSASGESGGDSSSTSSKKAEAAAAKE
jgi:putative FmdB family regulatory protein